MAGLELTSCHVSQPSASKQVGEFVKAMAPSSSVLRKRGSVPLASLAANSLRLLESNTTKENCPYKILTRVKEILCANVVPRLLTKCVFLILYT